jgi:hypothetical protein
MLRSALLCCLLLGACGYPHTVLERKNGFGGRPLPKEERPRVSDVPVHGFRVQVAFKESAGEEPRELEGELLAVDRRRLWIVVESEVKPIPRARLVKVNVELYKSRAGWIGLWSGLGTASAASHGWFALVSGPLWLLAGIGSTVTAATGNDVDVPLEKLHLLAQFARYPAGMPPPWGKLEPASLPASAPPKPKPTPTSRPAPASRPTPASRPASQPVPDTPRIEVDEPGVGLP